MVTIRLQKYLADCGVCSRRKVVELLEEKSVCVNGERIGEPGYRITPGVDRITINKRPVLPVSYGVYLLNKPRGVVTTMEDPEQRHTVAHFLPKHERGYAPVGRLDYHSTGLVILSNDGALADLLLHPRYQIERGYRVKVGGIVSEKMLLKLKKGVRLSDGSVQAFAKIIRIERGSTWLEITIKEGRNRIIRRLFEHLGHKVLKLHRESHGPFKLGKLKSGAIRKLSQSEYQRCRQKLFSY